MTIKHLIFYSLLASVPINAIGATRSTSLSSEPHRHHSVLNGVPLVQAAVIGIPLVQAAARGILASPGAPVITPSVPASAQPNPRIIYPQEFHYNSRCASIMRAIINTPGAMYKFARAEVTNAATFGVDSVCKVFTWRVDTGHNFERATGRVVTTVGNSTDRVIDTVGTSTNRAIDTASTVANRAIDTASTVANRAIDTAGQARILETVQTGVDGVNEALARSERIMKATMAAGDKTIKETVAASTKAIAEINASIHHTIASTPNHLFVTARGFAGLSLGVYITKKGIDATMEGLRKFCASGLVRAEGFKLTCAGLLAMAAGPTIMHYLKPALPGQPQPTGLRGLSHLSFRPF